MHRALYVGAALLVLVFGFMLATSAWADTPTPSVKTEQVHLEVSGLG